MEETKTVIITCPECGAQYVLEEIFYPSDVVGRPKNVIKDPLGKVLYVDWADGEEPVFSQNYVCDHCGKAFVADLEIKVKTHKPNAEVDFTELSSSLI